VRAGASAETIAAETGWPLDRVIRYAGPPLAERAYVAERASTVEIRRDSAGGSTTLSDSVDAALEDLGLYPDSVAWDAWRRSDGKWVVAVSHPGLPEGTVATWTYDHSGRNLHPLDEVARRFMESGHASIEDFLGLPEEPSDEEPETRPRLVAVAPAPESGSPAELEVATGSAAGGWPSGGSLSRQPTIALNRETTLPSAGRPPRPPAPQPTPAEAPAPAPSVDTQATPPPRTQPAPRTPAASAKPRPKGKGRRASVPSWDEILFGASKPDS